MRAFLTLVHRWCGLISMAFLIVAAVTGCILTLRGPIDRILEPQWFDAPRAVSPMGPDDALATVSALQAALPAIQPTRFDLNLPARRPLQVSVTGKPGAVSPDTDILIVEPGSGEVLAQRDGGEGFIATVSHIHFDLLAGDTGRWLLGTIAVLWLFSNLAGLVLTLPEKGPFWQKWWRTWQMRRSSSGPRKLLDLHRASGLWFLPFLTILAFTSVALNFWSEFYEPTVTAISPLERNLFDQDAPYPGGAAPTLSFAQGLERAEAAASEDGLAWKPATMLYLPDWNLYGVKFSAAGELNYRLLGPVDYYIDAATGAYVHKVDPYDDSAGLVMIRMIYPLHSGEIFGIASVVLVFVLGLVTLIQAVTGLYIWWKKRRSRIALRQSGRGKPA